MVITIDGYAGSGKSTAAKDLATALGFALLNTGGMYRAVGYTLREAGFDLSAVPRDATAIAAHIADFTFDLTEDRVRLNDRDLTDVLFTESMGAAASRVGTFLEVRRKLQAEQRRLAVGKDIICEGRDQGTVVFPDAPVKFFFDASDLVRAERRIAQEKLDPARLPEIAKQIRDRDLQDSLRDIDPLFPAPDALHLDTTTTPREVVLARMLEAVARCRSNR